MKGFEPCNQGVEEVLVGAFFIDDNLVKECTIKPEQLYTRKLRTIYSAIRSLDEKGIPIDMVTVVEELGVRKLEWVGGVSYIGELAGSVPTTANFHFYEQLVKEYDQKRKAIEIANKIINKAWGEEISKTLREGINELRAMEEGKDDEENGTIISTLADLYIECESDHGDLIGIPSGFTDLDRLTGGFQESDLIILGARPSVGKTAFALNLAMQAAVQDVSLIFSLEMSKIQLLKRLASFSGKINSLKMKNPKKEFEDEDWFHFSDSVEALCHLNLRIFDRAGMNMAYIWSKVRKMRREYGMEKRILVMIDYLQLIEGDPHNKQNRQGEISEISRALKTIARELHVTVLALSQLSRGVETRQDKRPILSDLRESGQIEQDADLIAFLYRDDYYVSNSPQKNIMEIILAKHRNGPTGTIQLGFHKEIGLFVNLVS